MNTCSENEIQGSFLICTLCKDKIPLLECYINQNGANELVMKCSCSPENKKYSFEKYFEEVKNIKPAAKCSKEHEGSKNSLAYCKQCDEYLCKDCLITHNKLRVNHSNSLSFMKINNFCEYHQNCVLDLYCKTCKVAICSVCIEDQHYKHDIVSCSYFNTKITKRALYEKYSQIKESFYNLVELYSKVLKYIEMECDSFPYIHDQKGKDKTPLTLDKLKKKYESYIRINNQLIEYVNSLFVTSQIEKNNINGLSNLVKNSIFNVMSVPSGPIQEIKDIILVKENIKFYIQMILSQFHTNVISPDFSLDVADYTHKTYAPTNKGQITFLTLLNDKTTIALLTEDNSLIFYSSLTFSLLRQIKGKNISETKIILITQLENNNIIFANESNEIIVFNYLKSCIICSFTVTETESRINHVIEYMNSCIAIASSDNIIRLYDLEGGIEICELSGHIGISSLISLGDGFLASGGCVDDTIMIWDVNIGECVERLHAHEGGVTILFLRKENFISASSDKSVKIWTISNLRCVKTLDSFDSDVSNICEMDDKKIAMSERGGFCVWIFDDKLFECIIKIRGKENINNIIINKSYLLLKYIEKSKLFVGESEDGTALDFWTYEN